MNLTEKILQLKTEKNVMILAHYYQRPVIQDIADAVGDSYYLSKIAKDCREDIIIFCGVKFMAESAKILTPEKTILLPAHDAGCPMTEMANVEQVIIMKEKHPNAAVVCYINSTADVKALCDVCVTSSNAINIIKNIDKDEIIFLPDKNLGAFIAKHIPQKKFILWEGFCITHKKVRKENVEAIKNIVDDVKVLVHPECEDEVIRLGDFVGSTGEIIDYAAKCDSKNYVIVTEVGVLHVLKKKNPNKNFYVPGSTMTCVNMKKTSLEDVYNSLVNTQYEINVEENTRIKAYNALMNMHKMAR